MFYTIQDALVGKTAKQADKFLCKSKFTLVVDCSFPDGLGEMIYESHNREITLYLYAGKVTRLDVVRLS